MKILHVTTCYPPTTFFTGPPQQIHTLAREMVGAGVGVRVVTTNTNGPTNLDVATRRWILHEGVPVYYGRRIPGTLDVSWDAWQALRSESRDADLLHVTGLFSWMNLAVAAVARRERAPFVVSPRGSLDPGALTFGVRKKAWFQRLGGARALREAAAFHVTSEKEAAEVTAAVPGARVGIVPNGVAIPPEPDLAQRASRIDGAPVVLFMGRIHPVKNVTLLVQAWASVAPRHATAKLVIAGPDDRNHRSDVERVVAELGVGSRVEFTGFVAGEAKSRLFATATCLVMPSATENFGNVAAEALANAVPVIASTGTPWRGLLTHRCGWWVDPRLDPLAAALDEALSESAAGSIERGLRGRRWMTDEFSWPSVARRMAEFYLSVVDREPGGSR